MLRNYLMAACRFLGRNRLNSAITLFGLTLGLCGALLSVTILRSELSYDRHIPAYERTYVADFVLAPAGRAPTHHLQSPIWLASQMKLQFSDVEAVTRVAEQELRVRAGVVTAKEKICWADPNVFDVLPLPAVSGDLRNALRTADSVVLTVGAARKYFGRENPVGASLQLGAEHPMKVTAVVADQPEQSALIRTGVFASSLAAYSVLTQMDPGAGFTRATSVAFPGRTYLRLARHASIEVLRRALPAFAQGVFPSWMSDNAPSINLIRLDKVHLLPDFNPGVEARLAMVAIVGVLILLVGCVNFISLSTALASRRSIEVGVRKALGAGRGSLLVQFLGEGLLCVLVAAVLALGVAQWLLPKVNAFLNTAAVLDYWSNSPATLLTVVGVVALGVAASAYPAWVLSGFNTIRSLKPGAGLVSGQGVGDATRQWLVASQFAALVGLVIGSGVTYEQLAYATHSALRLDTDQVLIIHSPCNATFKERLRRLAGVREVACSNEEFLSGGWTAHATLKDGTAMSLSVVEVQPGLLEMYGIRPTAGRLFAAERDPVVSQDVKNGPMGRVVLNESAVRVLGFASPAAAIGGKVDGRTFGPGSGQIIGTVPDFSLSAATQPILPTVYAISPPRLSLISLKLAGRDIPETLAAIDDLWRGTGSEDPLDRQFVADYIQQLYVSVARQTQILAVFSGSALLLACLGLIGLATAAAERRTKEIGVRKSLGAQTGDVLRLLVWQFIKPVLWANVIAWPLAAWIMRRWLHGFAYHVDLDPRLFVAAFLLSVSIATLTVVAHCYRVAQERPVVALRYE